MSIATELTLLANSKQAIKNSINQKGGSITDSTPFADYSTAIDNLPSGGSGNPLLKSIDVSDFSGTTFNPTTSYITGVTIPSGVTSIGNNAFSGCTSLTSVTIPSGVTSIGQQAFYNTSKLESVVLPNSVTTISTGAFYYSGIRSIVLPSNLTALSGEVLSECRRLTTVELPSSLTTLYYQAFKFSTGLTTITIPSGVTNIGNQCFYGCTGLTSVICLATTSPTLGSQAFDNANNCPIYVPAESVNAYKAATNWSTYASRIYPITQVATVDGNPVYNYELGNTNSTTILSTEMLKMPTGSSIEFAEGITNMGGEITGYTSVILPSTFTTFNDQDMIGSSVTLLIMKSTTPPTAERNKFGGSGLEYIAVPEESVDTYKAASGWSAYADIINPIE